MAPHDLEHPVPDQHGVNLFTSDPELRALLALYVPRDVLRRCVAK